MQCEMFCFRTLFNTVGYGSAPTVKKKPNINSEVNNPPTSALIKQILQPGQSDILLLQSNFEPRVLPSAII